MSQPINIALAADAGYLVHARVMLYSLYDSNRHNKFSVYLFTEASDHAELEKIKKFTELYGNVLHIMVIDKSLFENFFTSGHISVATYFRILIPDLLPAHVQKVIYLDTDIIVKKDIKELWETELNANCIAAVDEKNHQHAMRLGLPVYNAYFNAGVLLINTQQWKEKKIAKRGLELAAEYHDKLVAYDQDVLNILLVGQWLSLPRKWNQTEGHPLGRLLEEPTIIHFLGFKPWTIHCIHPYKHEYYNYYYKMEGNHRKIKDLIIKITKALRNRIALK